MWVMFIVGLIEMGANLFFLANMTRGKGLKAAKKFHGDFPAFASNRAWMNKILVSIVLGVLALIAVFSIYKSYESRVIMSSVFAGGMLLLCMIQAALYGKRHIPARISIVLGIAFVVLVFFGFRRLSPKMT
jgi:VIT1/CCC1 family predicted Fe2+/Mn2+ transporter